MCVKLVQPPEEPRQRSMRGPPGHQAGGQQRRQPGQPETDAHGCIERAECQIDVALRIGQQPGQQQNRAAPRQPQSQRATIEAQLPDQPQQHDGQSQVIQREGADP